MPVRLQDDFRVGSRAKLGAACFQLRPQLDVVVDLAVIGDDVSTARIGHRLRAEVQIDDGQTPVTERERRLTPKSPTIGTAMHQ